MANQYLENFREGLKAFAGAVDVAASPHQKAIAKNHLRHAALEFSGQDALILQEDMTIAEPVYHVKWGHQALQTLRGTEAVTGFYNDFNSGVWTFQDVKIWVNDWGMATYMTWLQHVTGGDLAAQGMTVFNPSDTPYALAWPASMFWPYTDDAKLIGEDIFVLSDQPTVLELREQERVTREDVYAIARSFL
jgi:hypothetical protein